MMTLPSRRPRGRRRGALLILAAFAVVPLVCLLALSLEGGALMAERRHAQAELSRRLIRLFQRDGYNATSVVRGARNLHGKLLIVHGIMDDNVHMQNSLQLIQALQLANKDNFEVMFYPHSRHGIMSRHYQWLMVDFMRRALGMVK